MLNFTYCAPTKVAFGRGSVDRLGELLREQGATKVLLHYGGGSAERSGLLGRVRRILDTEGIAWVELGGVVPNPRLSLVYRGIEVCKSKGVDFLLAVGGGSVIDSAKAIGYGAANDFDVWDIFDFKAKPAACLPVGAIVTIAAAGSEMSNSAVITKDEGGIKRGSNFDIARPKFAIMDPELTMTLPAYQTACGCADILMHTMERYLNHGDSMELTDALAEGLMRTVIRNAHVLMEHPDDYEARAEVMWASSLSHNGLTGCGTDGGDWSCHKLEHEIGGMFDVAHGAGLTAIWGSWARYVYRYSPDRFEQLAVRVLGVKPRESQEATILAGIEAMEEFYRSIGMPTDMHELGIDPTPAQIEELAEKCSITAKDHLGTVRVLQKADMAAIYRRAAGMERERQ